MGMELYVVKKDKFLEVRRDPSKFDFRDYEELYACRGYFLWDILRNGTVALDKDEPYVRVLTEESWTRCIRVLKKFYRYCKICDLLGRPDRALDFINRCADNCDIEIYDIDFFINQVITWYEARDKLDFKNCEYVIENSF